MAFYENINKDNLEDTLDRMFPYLSFHVHEGGIDVDARIYHIASIVVDKVEGWITLDGTRIWTFTEESLIESIIDAVEDHPSLIPYHNREMLRKLLK
nr:hypothetical protein K-LCC10_0193 [Kaumoebavirus]